MVFLKEGSYIGFLKGGLLNWKSMKNIFLGILYVTDTDDTDDTEDTDDTDDTDDKKRGQ